jgi:hypothetical protein
MNINESQLVSRGNSNFVDRHLKGAITIMKSGLPLSTPITIFLERVSQMTADSDSPWC